MRDIITVKVYLFFKWMNLHINWLIMFCFISLIFTFTLAILQLHIFRTQGIRSMKVIKRDIVFSLTCLCLVLKCWRCCLTFCMLTVSSLRLGYTPGQKSLLLLFGHSIWRAFCNLFAFLKHGLGGGRIQWLIPHHLLLIYGGNYMTLSVCLHLLPSPGDRLHGPK